MQRVPFIGRLEITPGRNTVKFALTKRGADFKMKW